MEKEQQKVQTEMELALAEIDRLKTFAIDFEKSNKLKREALESEITVLNSRIPALENDVEIQKETLSRMRKEIQSEQVLVDTTKECLNITKKAFLDTEKTLAERSSDLQILETTIKNEINRFDSLIAKKTSELKSVEKNITDAENLHNSNISKHSIELLKINKDILDANAILYSAKEEFKSVSIETYLLENESVTFRSEKGILEGDIESLSKKIKFLKEERISLTLLVTPLRKEMEAEQTKLKALIKERIQQHDINRAVVAGLDQREATLRERYEDVGLDYK